MVVSVLLKIKFGHAQISVLKISIYTDVENTLYQPMISYQLSSIIACFFLWYTQLQYILLGPLMINCKNIHIEVGTYTYGNN